MRRSRVSADPTPPVPAETIVAQRHTTAQLVAAGRLDEPTADVVGIALDAAEEDVACVLLSTEGVLLTSALLRALTAGHDGA